MKNYQQEIYSVKFISLMLSVLASFPVAFSSNSKNSSSSTGSFSSTGAVGPETSSSEDNSLSTEAIVGIIFGAIATFAIIVGFLKYIYERCKRHEKIRQKLGVEPFHAYIARQLDLPLDGTEHEIFSTIDNIFENIRPAEEKHETDNKQALSCYDRYVNERQTDLSDNSKKYALDLIDIIRNTPSIGFSKPQGCFKCCHGNMLKASHLMRAQETLIRSLCSTGQYQEYDNDNIVCFISNTSQRQKEKGMGNLQSSKKQQSVENDKKLENSSEKSGKLVVSGISNAKRISNQTDRANIKESVIKQDANIAMVRNSGNVKKSTYYMKALLGEERNKKTDDNQADESKQKNSSQGKNLKLSMFDKVDKIEDSNIDMDVIIDDISTNPQNSRDIAMVRDVEEVSGGSFTMNIT